MAVVLANRKPRGRAGFSLVELLIAAAVLLIIILGLLPLFTRATINNKSGADSMTVSNFARGAVEELVQLPMESAPLTVDAGTEKLIEEKYLSESKQWVPLDDPPNLADPAHWTRTATVRQYSWAAVGPSVEYPDQLTVDRAQALAAGTTEDVVLKEIVVEVRRIAPAKGLGDPKLTVRTFKSK